MNDVCDKSRVKGLLQVSGRKLINGFGEEVLLQGTGLGNWLLPEGYMWQFGGNPRKVDRPRRIEAFLAELAGEDYMQSFWKKFRDSYTAEADIKAMADAGFNSVRVPVNYRILIEDGESLKFIEEGFKLLDRVIGWCGKHGLYVIIDLHGAPGGQTGANIDDCVDDIPRLFIDKHQYEKCIMLWRAIAARYRDNDTVAAYDLLNEPLAPDHYHLLPKLTEFYADVIRAVREEDSRHIVSVEGAKWATDTKVFERFYDDKMLLHFHRYWCPPVEDVYIEFLELGNKLNVPLWLGESGENTLEWYADMFPLSIKLNISWNYWPWKRMTTEKPTICEIKSPENWDKVLSYLNGGTHPGYSESRIILDEYLNNVKIENVTYRKDVLDALLRGIK